VATADFITPPVNDPYIFGQVAAANALSDVYAMGGIPKVCLNLVSFPSKILPAENLEQILAGALSKITEAGAVLAGGHSVEDNEPKFGLSVVGVVHPDRVWTNKGARPGDVLVLTKPIGSGVLFNANLKKWVSPKSLQSCIEIISTLNMQAAHILSQFEVHAVTDITGFGLAGHALEMARGSGISIEFDMEAIPIMDEAPDMYRKGMSTGTNEFNRRLVAGNTQMIKQWPQWQEQLLYDPQTSGGLLAAIPADQADDVKAALEKAQEPSVAVIGRVVPQRDDTHLIFT
jgi:selenide,water dikinase